MPDWVRDQDGELVEPEYAEVTWQAGDVQSVRASWTLEQCGNWLEENESRLQDRLTELGFEVISALLPPELDELQGDEA